MRTLLPKEHLKAFGKFLENQGYRTLQPNGDYEIYRAVGPKGEPLILIYKSEKRSRLTVSQNGAQQVSNFYKGGSPRPENEVLTDKQVFSGLHELQRTGAGGTQHLQRLAGGALRLLLTDPERED